MAEVTFLEAIREALFDEMARDERVFVLGEDVGAYRRRVPRDRRAARRSSASARVIDTPISESAIIGAAIGAGVHGAAAGRASCSSSTSSPPAST